MMTMQELVRLATLRALNQRLEIHFPNYPVVDAVRWAEKRASAIRFSLMGIPFGLFAAFLYFFQVETIFETIPYVVPLLCLLSGSILLGWSLREMLSASWHKGRAEHFLFALNKFLLWAAEVTEKPINIELFHWRFDTAVKEIAERSLISKAKKIRMIQRTKPGATEQLETYRKNAESLHTVEFREMHNIFTDLGLASGMLVKYFDKAETELDAEADAAGTAKAATA